MMITIGVIGAGHWGPNLIRNFHGGPASIVRWICDRDERRLSQLQARFPDVPVTVDADEVLGDKSVDAVIISTPTATHYALARAALAAGKDVLVEKPLTTRAAEAAELGELAEKAGRVLMVGHVFLYNEGIWRVRKYLQEGTLGRVQYISMVRTNLGPIRTDVSATWDLASHDISIANYWLGTGPVSVSATGGVWINSGLEDAVFATLRYPDNVLVNLHASWLHPRKAREIAVIGESRMLTFDDMNLIEPIRIYDKQVAARDAEVPVVETFASFRASIRDGDVTIPRVALGEPLRNECEHFLECVRTGKKPETGAEVGLLVVRALEAIDRSLRAHGREEPVEA
jgi:predicted dehydrogenase